MSKLIKKMFLFFTISFLIVLLTIGLKAQISIWTDQNIYSEKLQAGKLIEILINERFEIKVDSNWNQKSAIEIKLKPEKEYQNFIKPAESSKTRKDDAEAKYKVNDNFKLSMMGVIGLATADGLNYNITALKNITLDGRAITIQLAGLIDASSVKNGRIESSKIANLNIQMTSKPPIEKDNSITMKTKTENNQQIPVAELSDAEKQKYILEYLREIIGNMNK